MAKHKDPTLLQLLSQFSSAETNTQAFVDEIGKTVKRLMLTEEW